MATIQIRNVPEDVHRIYRARAAAAGKSLQEYLLAELVYFAGTKSPAEVMAEVEQDMRENPDGWLTESAVDIIRAERESH
jgi:plasmid stability protein